MILQYMEVTTPIDTANEKLGCVCLRWSADDGVDHSWKRGTAATERGRRTMGEWFRNKGLGCLKGCVDVLRPYQ